MQLRKMHEGIFKQVSLKYPQLLSWTNYDELERNVDTFFQKVWEIRQKRIFNSNKSFKVEELFDYMLWTSESEFLDVPDFPVEKKHKIVYALHLQNILLRCYQIFVKAMKPLIETINHCEGREARILELASGSGKFVMETVKLMQKKKLQVVMTGSDYIPAYVKNANIDAKRLNLPVNFRVINAYNLDDIQEGEFDFIFIAQALHHFTSGQLARIIAGAVKAAQYGFLGIDGQRSFASVPVIAGLGFYKSILSIDSCFFHDALISSRRLYPNPHLEKIAKIAAPNASIKTKRIVAHTTIHIQNK